MREKNSFKTLREKEEGKFQLRISISLDRINFWTTGPTHMILQIVWLDRQKNIWREISILYSLFYILKFHFLISVVSMDLV